MQKLCRPPMSRRVSGNFRQILEKAFKEQKVSAVVTNSAWFIVHGTTQEIHSLVLEQLGVPYMSSSEYIQILGDSNWLLMLSDELYLEVLAFVSALPNVQRPAWDRFNMDKINSLRIVRHEYSYGIRLISIGEIKESKMAMYISPPQQGSYLSKWIERFSPWIQYRFLSQRTAQLMRKAGEHAGVKWLRNEASVREIDVKGFATEVVKRVTSYTYAESHPTVEAKFSLLVWKFVYTSIQEGVLEGVSVGKSYDFAVVNESGHVQWVKTQGTKPLLLLPRSCSKWPLLLTNKAWSAHSQDIVRMSDDYLNLDEDTNDCWGNAREECRVFLQKTFSASDLPDLPLPDIPFPQLTHLTSEESKVLLRWLSRFLETDGNTNYGRKFLSMNKCWESLQTTAWLHTREHGFQRPNLCFMPNDELTRYFDLSDVPFINGSFYGGVEPYSGVLHSLGVVYRLEDGCDAVAEEVKRLINGVDPSLSKEKVIKYYRYFQIYNWKPDQDKRSSMKIFIPAGTVKQASWQKAENCVIGDPENLFRGVLPILCEIYPERLLPFFQNVLKVPEVAPYAKYYDLWIQWRENLMHYDPTQCTQLWEKIAVHWESCSTLEKEKFKSKAALLTADDKGKLQFTSPVSAFIPDDLQLRSIFISHSSTPLLVWYPKGSSRYEAKLNQVYEYLGAKRLSACVEVISDLKVDTLSGCSTSSRPKFITTGLFIAILGFISNEEYAFSSHQRQSIIAPLCNSVEKEIPDPCCIRYTISAESSQATTAVERYLFGFWHRKEKVVYRLREAHELLNDAKNVRELETQVIESICSNILSDSPTIVTTLVDFLKLLVGCGFNESDVVYELRRKNLKLYSEDLDFLGTATNSLITRDVKRGVFNSLLLEYIGPN